jgi:hypothetical protein
MMTDTSVAAAHFAESDFRVGSVLSRSASVLSRHFLTFFIVTLIACLPGFLLTNMQTIVPTDHPEALSALLGLVLLIMLGALGQAVILHAVFQDIRCRPVRLAESVNVGLHRILPIVGLEFFVSFLILLGLILLIIPGLILGMMWFVGLQACVVERLGPWTSLRRSRELTRGHRWKVFGLACLLLIPSFGSSLIKWAAVVGPIVGLIGGLIWTVIWAAFASVVTTVTYHDLRVVKEGTDIEQIAAVFD